MDVPDQGRDASLTSAEEQMFNRQNDWAGVKIVRPAPPPRKPPR